VKYCVLDHGGRLAGSELVTENWLCYLIWHSCIDYAQSVIWSIGPILCVIQYLQI
jgi:hypothetical protein